MVNEFPIGCTLTKVLVAEAHQFAANELYLSRVVLFFRDNNVILTPLANTDEIQITLAWENQAILIDLTTPVWCDLFIGQKLQTAWICENAQGCRDQVIFAFGRLHPSIGFLSEGSALKAFHFKQNQLTALSSMGCMS